MLEVKDISVALDNFSLNNISFTVQTGASFCLLGESGSGKSIILEILGGILKPDSGSVLWQGKNLLSIPAHAWPVSLMFQDFALFPHKTVRQNLQFALRGKNKEESGLRINELADMLKISGLMGQNPGVLSEGEKQRVALARTILNDPDILLLDEPMASVDAALKPAIRDLLRKQKQPGKTVIHVTHDYEEALSLSDFTAIIQQGRLVDQGKTNEVFSKPKSEFTARMQGYKNLLEVEVQQDAQGAKIAKTHSGIQFHLAGNEEPGTGFILIHDSDIVLSEQKLESSACNNFLATVTETYPSPAGVEIRLDIGSELIASLTSGSVERMNIKPGKKIWASVKATAIKFFRQ